MSNIVNNNNNQRQEMSMDPQFYRIKAAVLGLYGVGKTALITRATRNEFNFNAIPTLGATYNSIYMTRRNKDDGDYEMISKRDLPETQDVFKFDIWDTAGQERYRSLLPMYYRGAEVLMFVHDGSRESKDSLERTIEEVREANKGIDITIGIVQNKADLTSIAYEKEFADKFKPDLSAHISAKSGQGVNSFVERLFRKHIEKIPKQVQIDPPTIVVEDDNQSEMRRTCCNIV